MNVYSIDVRIYATAYIKAETPKEAQKIARDLEGRNLELSPGDYGIEISGAQLGSTHLPAVSLSPAMTVRGPDRGARPDLCEEADTEDRDDEDEESEED